jgi:hypothetical protein
MYTLQVHLLYFIENLSYRERLRQKFVLRDCQHGGIQEWSLVAYSSSQAGDFNLLGSRICRSDDDRQVFRERAILFELTYLLCAVDTVEHGHLPIHQYDVQLLTRTVSVSPVSSRFKIVECFKTVLGNENLMSFRSELLTQDSRVDFIVLDQQDFEGPGSSLQSLGFHRFGDPSHVPIFSSSC